ncbi:hypothetical protein ACL02R_23335 [Streptomyces sp. MS19]|uniref:hypothetical protein n=1 Tax=Streptomyces sp. MS19 TaxID=3385972 RepID=UPI0039A22796
MTRTRRTAATAALLAAVAACAGDDADERAALTVPPPLGPPSADALAPAAPPDGPPQDISAAPRVTRAARPGAAVLPWEFAALRDGGREVVIRYEEGTACRYRPLGVLVEEGPDSVEIAPLSAELRPDPAEMCAAVQPLPVSRVIGLTEPLGDRPLLHAPTTPLT